MGRFLLLRLLVGRRGLTPLAKLLELYFAGDELLVFLGNVVDALALATLELYQTVL
jgi:hypothetical protein